MKLKLTTLCLIAVLIPLFSACNKNKSNSEDDDEPTYETIIYSDGREEIVSEPTISATIPNGKEMQILPDEWMSYYNDISDYGNAYYYYKEGVEISLPKRVDVAWTNRNPSFENYLLLDTDKQMTNAVCYSTDTNHIPFNDLFAGKRYYYRIKSVYRDRMVISRRFNFKTVDFFRTIQINNVLNARDLGNKVTNDGKKRVKQGLIYRTATFDGISELGRKQAIQQYGIKTDLDLREQGPTSSPLGPDVNYVNNGVEFYGSPFYVSAYTGVNVAEYQVAMRDNLKTLANKDNYPLAFHCAVGRDRTGTLAITLYLLLGVNLEQIKQDYVVSFFSKACNVESDFDAYVTQMEYLIRYFERFKINAQSEDIDIYQRTENYCEHIGVSKDEIASIRNILLENA